MSKEYKHDSPAQTAASVVELLKQIRDFLEEILEEMGFNEQNNTVRQSRVDIGNSVVEIQTKEKINEA